MDSYAWGLATTTAGAADPATLFEFVMFLTVLAPLLFITVMDLCIYWLGCYAFIVKGVEALSLNVIAPLVYTYFFWSLP